MLDLEYTLLIAAFRAISKVGVSVGGCMWVEDSHITECTFMPPSPEAIHGNIQPRTILFVRGSTSERFSREWLQVGSGSTLTSWHTSVKRPAVMSLISLCLSIGNPPLAQERAYSMEKGYPESHLAGRWLSGQSYLLRARASWKAPL